MKQVSVLLLVLFASLLALGAADENVVVIKKKQLDEVYEDSSEYNRMGKQISITGQLIGVGPNNAPSQGLSFAYFLDRNSQFVLDVMGSNSDRSFWGTNYTIGTSSAGLHYKRFTGNSFYFKVGVDQRFVDYNYVDGWSSSVSETTYDYSRRFRGSSTAASFVIGNQWQWSGFTMGCDWFGLVFPFASRLESETMGKDASESRLKEDQDFFLKRTIGQALRFYLGASF